MLPSMQLVKCRIAVASGLSVEEKKQIELREVVVGLKFVSLESFFIVNLVRLLYSIRMPQCQPTNAEKFCIPAESASLHFYNRNSSQPVGGRWSRRDSEGRKTYFRSSQLDKFIIFNFQYYYSYFIARAYVQSLPYVLTSTVPFITTLLLLLCCAVPVLGLIALPANTKQIPFMNIFTINVYITAGRNFSWKFHSHPAMQRPTEQQRVVLTAQRTFVVHTYIFQLHWFSHFHKRGVVYISFKYVKSEKEYFFFNIFPLLLLAAGWWWWWFWWGWL